MDVWSRRLVVLIAAVCVGLTYYCAAAFSLAFTKSTIGIATIWPPSGLILGALLLLPRRFFLASMVSAGLASIMANLQFGAAVSVALGFTAANLLETLIAAGLLSRSNYKLSFLEATGLPRFCGVAFLSATSSACIATCFASGPKATFWLLWFATDLLGVLVITPMILLWFELIRQRRNWVISRHNAWRAFTTLALFVLVTSLTFTQSIFPLLFLPIIALVATVFRLGPAGAALGVMIISAETTLAIAYRAGPFALIRQPLQVEVLFAQFYILCTFISAVPIAALLSARKRLVKKLAERNRLMKMAERAAGVGHWHLDAITGHLYWSAEAFRIHGRDEKLPPTVADAIKLYHPDDRALVEGCVTRAQSEGIAFDFKARLLLQDKQIKHVRSRGEVQRSDDGSISGLFGIIQDITKQVLTEDELFNARLAAEKNASHATYLAETDEVTGLLNRRKILKVLRLEMSGATKSQNTISVAIFDIDHFKQVNDNWGHPIGDQVLRAVAQKAQNALRGGDMLGRLGGEEFIAVLPGADRQASVRIAERLRRAIETGSTSATRLPPVTASFGVACLEAGETIEDLIERADAALYEAKNLGRNQTILAKCGSAPKALSHAFSDQD